MFAPRESHLVVPTLSPGAVPHWLAVYEWGDAENPETVLCLHGLTRNARDFDYLADNLATRYRVIAFDAPGRGHSEWLHNPMDYHYGQYLADSVALLDYLNIPQCDWVGTSMGGIVGMMLAAFYPARVRRLVLNDIGAVVAAEGLKRIAGYAGRDRHFPTRAAAEAFLREIFVPFGVQNEEEWSHIFTHSIVAEAEGFTLAYDPTIGEMFKVQTQNYTVFADVDLNEVWNAVICPTLILRGVESDILRAETARAMATKPNVKLVEFPCIGHAPTLMPVEQITTVREWLG